MGDLIVITLFTLTFSYFIFWGFLDMKKTNDFRTPLAGFGTILIIGCMYSIICMSNGLLVKTTIECYKLGGCMEDKFQRSIIQDYELEKAQTTVIEKINNKEVIK